MTPAVTLPTAFYNRDPRVVAVDLLGCVLVHETGEGRASGVIVEAEAYRPEDPACHAYKGPNMRNRTMFERAGLAYVYLSYGTHRLINVVCEGEGVGSAVLIRALRPLEGAELMARRRGRPDGLCNGPGKLSQALGVGLSLDGCDLSGGPLKIEYGDSPAGEIVSTTRVGITRGAEFPWRYLILDEKDVSVKPAPIFSRNLRRRPVRGPWL
ncbi:MAG: DNA-3-methyladenine glycosylase [Rubrobacteraceae bacterium]